MAASQTLYSWDTSFWEATTEHTLDDLHTVSTKANASRNVSDSALSLGRNVSDSALSLGRNVSDSAKFLFQVNAVLWHVAPPILLVLGTFGNVMTAVVMQGMRASQSTACLALYFTALAVSDQCVLTSCSLWFWVHSLFSWPPAFFRFDLLCSIPKFLWLTSASMSAWFLVAMTYQRVMSVVAPHRVHILCTVRRGRMVIAAVLVLSSAVNLQYLFTWSYWPVQGQCTYGKKYTHFADVTELLDLVWGSLIPFLLLASGNSVLIWQVIRSMRLSQKMRRTAHEQSASGTRQVHSMTATLILTSAAFLVLTLPADIVDTLFRMYYTEHFDDEFGAMVELARTVVDIMWLSSCASNFYLYVLTGRKFREETKQYLCCRNTEPAKWTV